MNERQADIVRNPLLGLRSAAHISSLPDEAKKALRELLQDLRQESAQKAQICWKKNKGFMAAYWKAVSVYAGHIARLAR